MNDEQNTPYDSPPAAEPGAEQPAEQSADEPIPTDRRPLGFWLRALDALISREFDAAFAAEGLSRRDWMLLNALDGSVEAPWLVERLARKGGKHLRAFEKRGWADEAGDGTWTLTAEGRAARERLATAVNGIRARIAGAVSPEDFATTMASLEAFARELGWDENARMPHFGRGRRGFGPGSRPGFGPAFAGFGPGAGHGPDSPAGFGPWSHRGFGPGFGRDFGPGFGRGFGPGARPGFGPFGPDPEDEGDFARGFAGHHAGHGHDGHPGYGHGNPWAHAEHHGHGYGNPEQWHREHHRHGGRGHGHHDEHGRSGGASTESAYERGFDAGYSRGAAEREG